MANERAETIRSNGHHQSREERVLQRAKHSNPLGKFGSRVIGKYLLYPQEGPAREPCQNL